MITLRDIQHAYKIIEHRIHRTPLLYSSELARVSDNNIRLKAEHLQKTGSFKIRGATNKMTQLAKEGTQFVTAASSGNHGQAVAYAASKHRIKATIVVPEDVIVSKVKAIRAYKGKIVTKGKTSDERIPYAKEMAEASHGIYVPPYDDSDIIAGQGTVGLEIMEQWDSVDVICVPVGGGGLLAGISTAIKEINPRIQIIGVEPEIANDTYLSLQKGVIQSISGSDTIADGLRANRPGDMTFPIVNKYVDDIVLVTEQEIKRALAFVLERMKQVIEPSGVVALAAGMSGKLGVRNKNIVCIASGGNIDLNHIGKLIK
ncbi:MAG TPA: threonine/serine dehydratase [Bacillota bacterium]|nr:threonine/serine dehydratase [Bacillota bacterium]